MEAFFALVTSPAVLDKVRLVCLGIMPFVALANLVRHGLHSQDRFANALMSLVWIAITVPLFFGADALGLTVNADHRRWYVLAAFLLVLSTTPVFGELIGSWWFSRMLKRIGRSAGEPASKDRS